MNEEKMSTSTKIVHAGEKFSSGTGAHIVPIYQTNTFIFEDYEQALKTRELINQGKRGYVYSRVGNPTLSALEEKMAALEGGELALSTSSGMAAISTAILANIGDDRHIICSDTVYGGTYKLLFELLPKIGIKTTFVDMLKPSNVRDALRDQPHTSIVFLESPANPTMKIYDIKAISAIAHEYGAKVLFDNTFMTAYFQNPLKLGADIVTSSLTKFVGGHGNALGGIIVGTREDIEKIEPWRAELGTTQVPFNAWLILMGVKPLAIRMEKESSNAMEIAKFLNSHHKVSKVYYPGLPGYNQFELAKKQMKGFGAVLSFEIKDGIKNVKPFLGKLKLCALGVSLGDVTTLIEHPATMTHDKLSEEVRLKIGITPGLIRLSVGLEDPDDIIEDLKQALA